jgi:hypothetical protein
MSKVFIGWAEETLVPDKKVALEGQFYLRVSEGVDSEITATAMAVEADDNQMIMVSCDLAAIMPFLQDITREKFAEICPEVDPRKIILAATHTHSSHTLNDPRGNGGAIFSATKTILNEFVPEENQYIENVKIDDSVISATDATEFVAAQIALAAKRAWENRAEAYYTNEFGRAAVGMCRRVCYDDGSAQMWGDTNTANFVSMEGGNDSGIELIYTFDTDKKLTGIVANIACPAQILEQRNFISADYWGRTKAILREKLGEHIYLLGLCGAAGDQCPRDLVRWVNPETPINDPNVKREHVIKRKADPSMYDISGCNRVGKRIANEIISIYEEITDLKEEAVFEHKIIDLDLPLRRVTIRDYDNAVREIAYYIEKNKDKEAFNYEDSARLNVHIGTIQRYRDQQFKNVVTAETHIIRFGDISISTNPFELFLDYGNIIKARSLSEQTFIIQLCCGGLGYLPTKKAEKGGHYSAYVSSGHVGHEGGDILVRKTIEEINKMF